MVEYRGDRGLNKSIMTLHKSKVGICVLKVFLITACYFTCCLLLPIPSRLFLLIILVIMVSTLLLIMCHCLIMWRVNVPVCSHSLSLDPYLDTFALDRTLLE